MNDSFVALAHPVRRKILRLLRDGPQSAGWLAGHFRLAKPTLSGHFSVLKNADLIAPERHGTTITYRLNISVVEEAMAVLLELIGTEGDEPEADRHGDSEDDLPHRARRQPDPDRRHGGDQPVGVAEPAGQRQRRDTLGRRRPR